MGRSPDGIMRKVELGKDLRFLLVAVGGGGIRVGRNVAERHLRYLETAAVNCDRRVLDEKGFDRQVYVGNFLGEPLADAAGSPSLGSELAHASEQEFEDLFTGATCVTIVASLGGGSGTGILPVLLDLAASSPDVAHLTLILIKPFAVEEERRRLSERAMAALYFISSLTDMVQSKRAKIIVLDNESLSSTHGRLPVAKMTAHYGSIVAQHIMNYISAGEIETVVQQVTGKDILGTVPGLWPAGADAGSLGGIGMPQGVATAAYLRASVPPPSLPRADTDVEFVLEAEAGSPPERPKGPSPRPD